MEPSRARYHLFSRDGGSSQSEDSVPFFMSQMYNQQKFRTTKSYKLRMRSMGATIEASRPKTICPDSGGYILNRMKTNEGYYKEQRDKARLKEYLRQNAQFGAQKLPQIPPGVHLAFNLDQTMLKSKLQEIQLNLNKNEYNTDQSAPELKSLFLQMPVNGNNGEATLRSFGQGSAQTIKARTGMYQAGPASNYNTSVEKTGSPLARAGFFATGNSNEFVVQEKEQAAGDQAYDTGEKVLDATMLQDCLRSTSFQVVKESHDKSPANHGSQHVQMNQNDSPSLQSLQNEGMVVMNSARRSEDNPSKRTQRQEVNPSKFLLFQQVPEALQEIKNSAQQMPKVTDSLNITKKELQEPSVPIRKNQVETKQNQDNVKHLKAKVNYFKAHDLKINIEQRKNEMNSFKLDTADHAMRNAISINIVKLKQDLRTAQHLKDSKDMARRHCSTSPQRGHFLFQSDKDPLKTPKTRKQQTRPLWLVNKKVRSNVTNRRNIYTGTLKIVNQGKVPLHEPVSTIKSSRADKQEMHSLLWSPTNDFEVNVVQTGTDQGEDQQYQDRPLTELSQANALATQRQSHLCNSMKPVGECIPQVEPSEKVITLPRYSPSGQAYDEQTLRTRPSVRTSSFVDEKSTSIIEEKQKIRQPKIKVSPNFILKYKGEFIDHLGKTHQLANQNLKFKGMQQPNFHNLNIITPQSRPSTNEDQMNNFANVPVPEVSKSSIEVSQENFESKGCQNIKPPPSSLMARSSIPIIQQSSVPNSPLSPNVKLNHDLPESMFKRTIKSTHPMKRRNHPSQNVGIQDQGGFGKSQDFLMISGSQDPEGAQTTEEKNVASDSDVMETARAIQKNFSGKEKAENGTQFPEGTISKEIVFQRRNSKEVPIVVSADHSPRRSSPDDKDSMPNAQYGGIMNDIQVQYDGKEATETLKTSSFKKSPEMRPPTNQGFKLVATRQSQQHVSCTSDLTKQQIGSIVASELSGHVGSLKNALRNSQQRASFQSREKPQYRAMKINTMNPVARSKKNRTDKRKIDIDSPAPHLSENDSLPAQSEMLQNLKDQKDVNTEMISRLKPEEKQKSCASSEVLQRDKTHETQPNQKSSVAVINKEESKRELGKKMTETANIHSTEKSNFAIAKNRKEKSMASLGNRDQTLKGTNESVPDAKVGDEITSLNTEWARKRQSASYSPINLTSRLGSPASQNLRRAQNQVSRYIDRESKLDKMLRDKPPAYLRPNNFGLKRMFPNPRLQKKKVERSVRQSQTIDLSTAKSPKSNQEPKDSSNVYKLAIEVKNQNKYENPSFFHTVQNQPPATANSFSVQFSQRPFQGKILSPYDLQNLYRDRKPKTSKNTQKKSAFRRRVSNREPKDSVEHSCSQYSSNFGDRPTPKRGKSREEANWALDKWEQRKVQVGVMQVKQQAFYRSKPQEKRYLRPTVVEPLELINYENLQTLPLTEGCEFKHMDQVSTERIQSHGRSPQIVGQNFINVHKGLVASNITPRRIGKVTSGSYQNHDDILVETSQTQPVENVSNLLIKDYRENNTSEVLSGHYENKSVMTPPDSQKAQISFSNQFSPKSKNAAENLRDKLGLSMTANFSFQDSTNEDSKDRQPKNQNRARYGNEKQNGKNLKSRPLFHLPTTAVEDLRKNQKKQSSQQNFGIISKAIATIDLRAKIAQTQADAVQTQTSNKAAGMGTQTTPFGNRDEEAGVSLRPVEPKSALPTSPKSLERSTVHSFVTDLLKSK